MGKETNISWTSSTWNPWQGCQKISSGCKHCYMFRDKTRYGQDPSVVVRSKPKTFLAPLNNGLKGPLVFTCSWSDFFIDRADSWRDEAWDIIRQTPQYIYQILTKRPMNIFDRLPGDWGEGWPNVWLGVTVEEQDYTQRINLLARVPARLRFVSYEPSLGPVNWARHFRRGQIDWLISGGESGPQARNFDMDWYRSARDQCFAYDVPYFHKQHGGSKKIDGVWGGCEIDNHKWAQFPTCPPFYPEMME